MTPTPPDAAIQAVAEEINRLTSDDPDSRINVEIFAAVISRHLSPLLEQVEKERDEAMALVRVAQSQRDDAWQAERYLLAKCQELRERYEPLGEP